MSYSRDLQRTNAATFKRSQAAYDAMEHPDYYEEDPVPCRTCGNPAEMDSSIGPVCEACHSMPVCPKCGNNRQVWENQITGKITCHRAYCHTVIEEN